MQFSYQDPSKLQCDRPMDAEKQQHYIQMARGNPNMLCSEVPEEILEQASYDHLIAMVMQLFRPGRCTLSLFASKVGVGPPCKNSQVNDFSKIKHFVCSVCMG